MRLYYFLKGWTALHVVVIDNALIVATALVERDSC